MDKNNLILAIETSCDETSVAIVKNGREILSNVISSQVDTHKVFGGVVPEIASRKHVEVIDYVLEEALKQANISFHDIDAIGVTCGAGLVGALLVGVSYAKALAFCLKKPLIAVNHIEGHICANYIEYKDLVPPFLCLVISGGHTHLVHVKDYLHFDIIGRTRDDACGEAFDKVARTIGLSYPGGPELEKLALLGDSSIIKLPRVMLNSNDFDFSFSGLKSSVLNFINNAKMKGENFNKEDLAASFQETVADILVNKSLLACKDNNISKLAIAGGVSANSYLRERIKNACEYENISFYVPSIKLCTDNAAMIASSAYFKYINNDFARLDLNAYPNLKIGENISYT